METKEFTFRGVTFNGFAMLFFNLLLTIAGIAAIVLFIGYGDWRLIVGGPLLLILSFFIWPGFIMLEPNEARVLTFFGKYRGTFTKTGYYWINPFMSTKKLSLRARNLDAQPIKVNDKTGNPIMIGLVLVWKLKDTYKAMFEIDAQTMAQSNVKPDQISAGVSGIMKALEQFVQVQSDAALRQVAGQYAYDDTDDRDNELTLRGGGDEINQQLENKLNERLALAGIEVVEARINYLAYAPEIAAVMLRRQQAAAIITAREKIVEGAVSMVKMALDKLSAEDVMVVLCGDDAAQPVVNTGTLNH